MGESNRVRTSYAKEVTWGVALVTPTMKELSRTGGSIKAPMDTVTSNRVRSHRNRTDVLRTGQRAEFTLEDEVAYGNYDDLIEAALAGAFSTPETTTASLTIVAATRTVTMAAAFDFIVAGQWIKISGAINAANNGYWRVQTRTSAGEVIVFDPAPAALVNETATASVTIKVDGMLRNGTTQSSWCVEQEHVDLAIFLLAVGLRVNSAQVTIPNTGLITLSMQMQGKQVTAPNATIASVLTPANSNQVFSATENFFQLLEGGGTLADDVQQVQFSVSNNLRVRRVPNSGSVPKAIKYGTLDVTGSLSVYPNGESMVEKYLAFTESSLSFRLTDTAGNTYIVTFPRYKYTGDGLPDTGGLDGDVTMAMPFTAFYSSTYLCSVQIDKFAA